ncbi:MAG: hypothetical protein HN778_04950 [Prolixibacteraceae bacterium]|jgi:hypothetical protein|nr:hypothetical protein [Prolixibacteraceae bacterium]MBT6766108.1 hypothetical protein [Prolixibacteraceae bacterium]MBT6998219.1 hypothetical protein [Prolixibacteraceae bacterium]MBT7394165.1 hypothetical protein [Prolixibacteraceae bacterium]
MKADSIYKKPWFSYSTMVKSEVGKISISKQGLKTVFMDGINLYRGINMGPNHHREGLKLHYVRFIKVE